MNFQKENIIKRIYRHHFDGDNNQNHDRDQDEKNTNPFIIQMDDNNHYYYSKNQNAKKDWDK